MHAWVLLVVLSCWAGQGHWIPMPNALACTHVAVSVTATLTVLEGPNPWTLCVQALDRDIPVLHWESALASPRDCVYPG